jgi:hypothetical protein
MVTASQAVKMYELLNKYFKNTEDSKAVVASIEGIIDTKFDTEKDGLATKQDIFALQAATKQDISALQAATKQEISALQAATKQDISDLQAATKQDIFALQAATKQEISALQAATKQDIFALQIATKQDIFCLKEDVLALQARMEQGFKDQLRWLIVLMVGLSSLGIAVLKLT